MTRKQKRLLSIALIGAVLALAATLAAIALRDEIVFFYDPTEVVTEGKVSPGQRFRIGGLVEQGSVTRSDALVEFRVTDGQQSVKIEYDGLLPDLFREGQGVIAEGSLDTLGIFKADTVLAKHDEKYVPKELEGILKEKNVWKGSEAQ